MGICQEWVIYSDRLYENRRSLRGGDFNEREYMKIGEDGFGMRHVLEIEDQAVEKLTVEDHGCKGEE